MYKLVIGLLLISVSAVYAQNEEFAAMQNIETFKKGISDMAKSTTSIKASFKQEKYLSILSEAVASSGEMYFKKPGRLKWAYTSPYNYAIVLNGEEIKINDEGKVNSFAINNSKVFKQINDLIIKSVQGDVLQEDEFDIVFKESKSLYLAQLTPINNNIKDYITHIDVYFEKNDFSVKKIKLFESEDDYTLITFQKKQFNVSISDNEFSF
ncbi:LolA family protein [Fulvivirga sediminis]|uniref:Outer membrane lipoprotein carrier protein LolA n=1 Tax=Fulvivirga sediminis TaxID=2803949 RepID=A0A937FA57_9BACT|nr:outer membrane lipoprotein carrier protein LolA [Fulvivirga sediminis]MBL3656833.1 outer membrane lipoprotein carrier protein LolA [Fulvivirga sediminis]